MIGDAKQRFLLDEHSLLLLYHHYEFVTAMAVSRTLSGLCSRACGGGNSYGLGVLLEKRRAPNLK